MPRTRDWLIQELNGKITEWDSLNPLRKHATCIDLLTYGKDFYLETKHDEDFELWDRAVTKVEAYLSNKKIKYHGVEEKFRTADEGFADYFKNEKDQKTEDREKLVTEHRNEIKKEKLNKLKTIVTQRESTYKNAESNENLEAWKRDLIILMGFAQHQMGSDQVQDFPVAYEAAAKAHQQKYSFKAIATAKVDSFCFRMFKCCYQEVEEAEQQIQEAPSGTYNRL